MIHIPGIPLTWLNKLCGCIIIRNIKPKAMRNSCWNILTKTERVATHKVCAISVWIIKSIEKIWSSRTQNIFYVLLKGIDILARWVFRNLFIVMEEGFRKLQWWACFNNCKCWKGKWSANTTWNYAFHFQDMISETMMTLCNILHSKNRKTTAKSKTRINRCNWQELQKLNMVGRKTDKLLFS